MSWYTCEYRSFDVAKYVKILVVPATHTYTKYVLDLGTIITI